MYKFNEINVLRKNYKKEIYINIITLQERIYAGLESKISGYIQSDIVLPRPIWLLYKQVNNKMIN